ncbi:energy-coupling factor transporter ATPase [Clostridium estertheticum]|uniref:Energy-coupling factor transporter ATP-binding protein EcfA2 n=2 Tax=Clostridium estertheticum TaxID=238834 RepID=A0A1J0GLX7_9CLOT|nr:energy-coupling factor transporter ATPase [Clostridium estertheticum]APC42313.1 energy-coupling factor transporter ATPase [Clostridium estertheticum subsp. estertheticum]MBU3073583.1 energy-coupling factor transporter ATPase [Clostridium estertheticum]MBU3163676.1 energy-coupling factor transporter ATPase [Clostridium estertheticum]MBU3172173.1 energy-coupling factor transporter ATPase [Clostridium estertheticum]MBU3186438.1 energy-coupling factor transporter ATPase [Clostridium esterthetic
MSIKIENLTYIYMPKTPFEKKAIDDVSIEIKQGEFVALIGHTGSGKSTLIQHINGLLKPTSGTILVDDIDITKKKMKLTNIRKKVGLVFQYPEYQLFEETIEKDISFGPRNLGLDNDEINRRVQRAMKIVGLGYEEYKDKSPFEISGGQKRRVAIAGVVAMEPKVLILDEPTAGLDPKGRDDILNKIVELYKANNMTIILVSHSMEDVAKVANRVLVMDKGKCILDGTPEKVFREIDTLESVGLAVPQVTYLIRELRNKGFDLSQDIFTIEKAKQELFKILKKD